jgi:trk system potassium uptake protein TrkH
MPLFDSVATAFGTAGTGGFGIKNSSIADYSAYIQWIVAIFMILFGINFNAYYLILYRQFRKAFTMEEIRAYLLIIIASVFVITLELVNNSMAIWDALRHSTFQVASIITTTGFATADFNQWTALSRTILVLLMFIGACAGSTGGGIKVSRFILVIKTVFKEIGNYLHPRSVKKINLDNKPVEHEVMRATNVYFITFFVLFIFSLLAVSLEEKDLVTNFTAVAATINNIGPGLEMVGPTANFAHFNPFSKWVLMFDMLAGRLELFPMLMLFVPRIWKDFFARTGTLK